MIELKVAGCYGASVGNKRAPTYLLKETLALDGGSLHQLTEDQQKALQHVLISHPHLDHCMGVAMLAYNNNIWNRLTKVYATSQVIERMKQLFDRGIWAPFHEFPNEGGIRFQEISYNQDFTIEDFVFCALPVNHHADPATKQPLGTGYLVSRGSSLLYTGDTGILKEDFWERMRKNTELRAAIIDCNYSDEDTEKALLYKHLCPSLIEGQIEMLGRKDVEFLATHLLPSSEAKIKEQLQEMRKRGLNVSWLEQGLTYRFG